MYLDIFSTVNIPGYRTAESDLSVQRSVMWAELEGVAAMCNYNTLLILCYILVCVADDFQLGVVVIEEGLMLTVRLQTAIPGPVRLSIKYTWIIQPDTVERTSSTTFVNRREIVHQISRSTVPFQQFRLQVALVVGRVVGPFVPDLENATVISKYSVIAHVATMVNH